MPETLPLLARWAHILAAITLLGGGLFVRVVLFPTMRDDLSTAERDRLRSGFIRRWKWMVHSAIFLLLVSGFYNYLVLTYPLHEGQPLYHALIGTKMLLAFVVFFLVIVVTSSGKMFQKMRAKAPTLMLAAVTLGIVIVLLSGFAGKMP